MVEKLPNRPAGGRDSDFNELNDWTITDIATAPKTAPEDRRNAKAEIARREEAGTYNPDEAPQEVRIDLLDHGYGVEKGKVLYPKPEYKSWLESDRSEPIPSGPVRESIEDRARVERREAIEAREAMDAERRRGINRATGEATIRAFEKYPTRKRINHPPRFATQKEEIARERETEKKAADMEIHLRRRAKQSNRYDNIFLNSERIADSEARANLPITEVPGQPSERVHDPKTAEARAERLYHYYVETFPKNAPKWVSFGMTSLLEKGVINPPVDSLLRSGFWSREESKIHERIDPEDTFSLDAIDAESSLKTLVTKEIIDKRAATVPGDELRDAKRDGLLYAAYAGARVDDRSGKIIYSIPFEKGDEVVKFMKENGVDPDSEKVQLMSYNGFIGIIEAIKGDKKATEKGFKALDWYFDTFGYKKHMDEFIDTMDAYQEFADKSFGDKLDEYLARRKELEEWQKQQLPKQEETISALADARGVTYEELVDFLTENMADEGEDRYVDIFPIQDMNSRRGNHIIRTRNEHPTSIEKCTKVMQEIEKILKIDPSASFAIGTVFERDSSRNKKQKAQDYAIIRFGNNDFNNVIAAHIGSSSKAIFCWRGKTGDNADGWRDHFRNSSIRTRSTEVKRFVCRGYGEKGFQALNDQWNRIWEYLNSPDKEGGAA